MLANPEYSSPPGEVCCWPGRRGGAAGTGSQRKQLAGTPWRSCWYGQPAEAAGRGAVAELLVRAASGSSWRERCGGMERSGSLCGKACRWASDYAAASWKSLPLGERRRCGKGKVQSSIGKRLNGSNQHFTPFLFQCHRPHIAIPIITKYNSAA